MTGAQRLIVASNRLPVTLRRGHEGDWKMERSSGGLVTALEPVLREQEGTWIGWPGVGADELPDVEAVLERESGSLGYRVRGVGLTAQEEKDFYLGFSNQVVWPLFHDFQTYCNFDPTFWRAYREVNRRFAKVIADESAAGDFIWVHDYHLMSVAEELWQAGEGDRKTGFFLHIPFPPLDLFLKLPWRFTLLRSLLHYDLIGFQTGRDRRNFLECLRTLAPGVELEGEGRVVRARVGKRTVRVGAFPISIDFDEFADEAASNAVSERVARLWSEFPGRQIILGVDRLDYSKGIPHKLHGFRLALHRYPSLQERVSLVQLVVPSREDIPEYHAIRTEIERLVGRISGEFTRPGWVPIHYKYGQWDRPELIAHYRAARVSLVTSLKDGMNLVAKEFSAASLEADGVLILSEYAGATAQLQKDALLVNPYDVEEVAEAIHQACNMKEGERRKRMGRIRDRLRKEDIFWWVDTFLKAARDEDLGEWNELEVYQPPAPPGFFDAVRD